MERLPTNYNLIKDMTILTSEDLLQIELMAKTLSLNDCLATLFLLPTDLPERELDICTRVHARGRQIGVKEAGENLFGQMKTRTGTQACLEYLKQMSSAFLVEVSPGGGPASGNGFSFNIYPPGPPPPDRPADAPKDGAHEGNTTHPHLKSVD